MKSSKSLKRVFSAFLVLCMLMSNLLVPVGATELEMEQSITDVVVYSESGDGTGTGESGDGEGTGESGDGTGSGESGDGEGTGEGGDGTGSGESGEGEGGENQQPGDDEVLVPFSCFTLDAEGRKLNAYWSEKNSVWYLFVPSTQEVSDTVIYYTGRITATDSGTVDAENGKITDAFLANGDRVTLVMSDETVHTVVVMQSQLPSVQITLNGVTLQDVHADKDKKHKKNSVAIMDPVGEYNLEVENSVELKGRGNSTWKFYDKKGYQIKFAEETSVLGMGKAEKWVLLANASDDSMMRTMLVYRMAKKLGMAFVPSFEYVDLWINGDYCGTYILGDKIEPGSSRLDLSDDAGAIFESDEAFYAEEDYWFYSEYLRYHFVMKEIMTEEDDVIAGAMDDFSQAADELAAYLYNTPSDEVTLDALSKMIDVDSFIKYFLVNEYVLNKESFVTSFYWYKDGPEDVIHLGPIWDFDTCMGNDGSSYTDQYGQKYFLFNYLFAAPAFYERFEQLHATYQNALLSMNQDVAVLKAQIADSAEMNYLRWNVLGKPNPKGGNDFKASFDDAVAAVETWLQGRAKSFAVTRSKVVTSTVSDDCYEMDIFLEGEESYEQVKFGVWSYAGGQNDIRWYQAYERDDGVWTYKVDLTKHSSAGLYRIEAFANNKKPLVASGCNYVKTVMPSPYKLTGDVTADCKTMSLRLSDTNRCSDITFALWSREDGQDDLHWYPAKRNADGVWAAEADLGEHASKGTYTLHAYTGTGKARRLVEELAVDVAFAVYNPKLTTEITRECTSMDITLSRIFNFEQVWVELRKNTDPATAATRYDLVQGNDSDWLTLVDLTVHGGAGAYTLSFSGMKNGVQEKILDAEIVAELLVFPVYRLYNRNTQEHLLTANEDEMNGLLTAGWTLDGQAWKATKIGTPVYRLYNPFDDWHTYSTSQDEIASLTTLGWTVDGIVFHSVEEEATVPVYRLFNPYEQKNYHLLTASESEKDQLLSLGWTMDGVALNALQE